MAKPSIPADQANEQPSGQRAAIDWEGIERDYRAGIMSVREIAGAHGCSHTLINRKAKAQGWTRDLTAKIQAKAEALVSKQVVSTDVSKQALATEREIIEANATRIAQVRSEHRGDIAEARILALHLLAELKQQTAEPQAFAQLFELLHDGPEEEDSQAHKDRHRKRLEAFERAMSLGGRTKTLKDLADSLKTLIALEREAYGIDKLVEKPLTDVPIEIDDVTLGRQVAFLLQRANSALQAKEAVNQAARSSAKEVSRA